MFEGGLYDLYDGFCIVGRGCWDDVGCMLVMF